MVGTVGRTDLLGPELRDDLARQLYRALRDEILTLPDDLPVYPTHGAGSFCSAPGASERTTTIGRERATNPMLAAPDEDTFVEQLVAGFGSFPTLLLTPARGEPARPAPVRDAPDTRRVSTSTKLRDLLERGALLVDVRPIDDVRGRAHPRRAVDRVAARVRELAGLARRPRPAARLRPRRRPGPRRARTAMSRASATNTSPVSSTAAWRPGAPTRQPEATIELVGPDAAGRTDLDVRQRNEYDAGHVPGSVHIELGSLTDAADDAAARARSP